MSVERFRFFKNLRESKINYKYKKYAFDLFGEIEWGIRELIQRGAFTAIGVIMVMWSWQLLSSQFTLFPNCDWLTVIIATFTLLLGIRNVLSLFKDVTFFQAFLTILFVAVNAYLVWFS